MPIWNIDKLKTPMGIVDIGLIRDEANELAPRRGPLPQLPPLCDNLADRVPQTYPVESIPGSSTYGYTSTSQPALDTEVYC